MVANSTATAAVFAFVEVLLETFLGPVVTQSSFTFRTDAAVGSPICHAPLVGRPALQSFGELDYTFGMLVNLQTAQYAASYNITKRCYCTPAAECCDAVFTPYASDCYFENGTMASPSRGLLQQYSTLWAPARKQLRLNLHTIAHFAMEIPSLSEVATAIRGRRSSDADSTYIAAIEVVLARARALHTAATANLSSMLTTLLATLPYSLPRACLLRDSIESWLSRANPPANVQVLASHLQSVVRWANTQTATEDIVTAAQCVAASACLDVLLALLIPLRSSIDFSTWTPSGETSLAAMSLDDAVGTLSFALSPLTEQQLGATNLPQFHSCFRTLSAWVLNGPATINSGAEMARQDKFVLDCFGEQLDEDAKYSTASFDVNFSLPSSAELIAPSIDRLVYTMSYLQDPLLLEFYAVDDGTVVRSSRGVHLRSAFHRINLDAGADLQQLSAPSFTLAADSSPLYANLSCPTGRYRMRNTVGDVMCRQCVNEAPDFYYCPGDNYRHLCGNKPVDGTVYVPQGAAWSSPECPFMCSKAPFYRMNAACALAPSGKFPTDGGSGLEDCKPPRESLQPHIYFTSGGLRGDPTSCSFIFKRRGISQSSSGQELLRQMRLCSEDAGSYEGFHVTAFLALNTSWLSSILQSAPQPSLGFEVLAVLPVWQLILIAYPPYQDTLGREVVTVQLAWNTSTAVYFSGNRTLFISKSRSDLYDLTVTASVSHSSQHISFFFNYSAAGPPRPFNKAGMFTSCASGAVTMGVGGFVGSFTQQRRAQYTSEGSFNSLPLNYTLLPAFLSRIRVVRAPLNSRSWRPTVEMAPKADLTSSDMADVVWATPTQTVQWLTTHFRSLVDSDCPWGMYGKKSNSGAQCEVCPVGSAGSSGTRASQSDCTCLPSYGLPTNSTWCQPLKTAFGAPLVSCLPRASVGEAACNVSVPESSIPADCRNASASFLSDISIDVSWTCSDEGTVLQPSTTKGLGEKSVVVSSCALPGGDRCQLAVIVSQPGRSVGAVSTASVAVWPLALPLRYYQLEPQNGSSYNLSITSLSLTIHDYVLNAVVASRRLSTNATLAARVKAALDAATVKYAVGVATSLVDSTSARPFVAGKATIDLPPTGRVLTLQVFAEGFLHESPVSHFVFYGAESSVKCTKSGGQRFVDFLGHPATVACLSVLLVGVIAAAVWRWKVLRDDKRDSELPTEPIANPVSDQDDCEMGSQHQPHYPYGTADSSCSVHSCTASQGEVAFQNSQQRSKSPTHAERSGSRQQRAESPTHAERSGSRQQRAESPTHAERSGSRQQRAESPTHAERSGSQQQRAESPTHAERSGSRQQRAESPTHAERSGSRQQRAESPTHAERSGSRQQRAESPTHAERSGSRQQRAESPTHAERSGSRQQRAESPTHAERSGSRQQRAESPTHAERSGSRQQRAESPTHAERSGSRQQRAESPTHAERSGSRQQRAESPTHAERSGSRQQRAESPTHAERSGSRQQRAESPTHAERSGSRQQRAESPTHAERSGSRQQRAESPTHAERSGSRQQRAESPTHAERSDSRQQRAESPTHAERSGSRQQRAESPTHASRASPANKDSTSAKDRRTSSPRRPLPQPVYPYRSNQSSRNELAAVTAAREEISRPNCDSPSSLAESFG